MFHYGFAAVALLSNTGTCLVSRTLYSVADPGVGSGGSGPLLLDPTLTTLRLKFEAGITII